MSIREYGIKVTFSSTLVFAQISDLLVGQAPESLEEQVERKFNSHDLGTDNILVPAHPLSLRLIPTDFAAAGFGLKKARYRQVEGKGRPGYSIWFTFIPGDVREQDWQAKMALQTLLVEANWTTTVYLNRWYVNREPQEGENAVSIKLVGRKPFNQVEGPSKYLRFVKDKFEITS